MNTQLLDDCRFCSIVSKSNQEDPIGTANPCDAWLIAEIPLPWTAARLQTDPVLQQLYQLLQLLQEQPIRVSLMAIAPDPEYSVPGYTRVLHYQRPDYDPSNVHRPDAHHSAKPFAQFDAQEFLIPPEQLPLLATALLMRPEQLQAFLPHKQPPHPRRDLMVCTHGNVDVACARFGYPIYKTLRQHYAARSQGQLRVWRCSHFGGHQFAPTLVDLPLGQVWGHLEPESLEPLVQRDRAVTELRQFYRGWSGLSQFEQIVEREIWMQQGWDWLNYHKTGQVLAQDTEHEDWDADWAEVRLDFASSDGHVTGSYRARVEVCGSVMTVWNSGDEPTAVKQYRVSSLVRVA